MTDNRTPYFQLAILGGGINGVSIARDAAQRGLSVLLLEKMILDQAPALRALNWSMAGLRYLTSYAFGLVKESLQERALLLKNAPHLVKRLPFLFPVYRGDAHPLWMVKLGIALYDWLSPNGEKFHQNLTQAEISAAVPTLLSAGLKGGCSYFDAQMQDNRLVIENMRSAEAEGATLFNYTSASAISRENELFRIETERGPFYSKCLVNATGAWSNLTRTALSLSEDFLVYPTKGVHLVLPQIHSGHALALTAPQDGRLLFVIPWMGYSLLGTTDTPFSGDPDHVAIDPEDRDYLLERCATIFLVLD